MKRIKYLLFTYLIFIAFFIVGKPVFLFYHWEETIKRGLVEGLATLWYGLPMDMSVAGYFTILPTLVLFASLFVSPKICSKILSVYFLLTSTFISLLYIPDLELYSHWGFRIDPTVLTYIIQPVEAAASVSGWTIVELVLLTVFASSLHFYANNQLVAKPVARLQRPRRRVLEPVCLLALSGLLFVVVRGGVTTSTMNVGKVYFSESMYLNHAAVNPVFNMLSGLSRNNRFDRQYRFMDDQTAADLVEEAFVSKASPKNRIPSLLSTSRPNIVFILLESFGAAVSASLGGLEGVAPNLDSLAAEGILFSRMYASSFRTDRGIVSALAGYPAQPTMSLIKYPKKSERLLSIMSSLKDEGYQTSFLHGGDVDFAYIKSFLVNQKVTDITRDTNFPVRELLNKWGAPDHITFERLLKQIKEDKGESPYLKVFLTLSSHEPFDVPYARFEHPYVNAVAYTDSCLGRFIDQFKQLPQWENTLLIVTPDHDMRYPEDLAYFAPERHDIFMIWAGGAIKEKTVVPKICSQTDIAATLLSQLGISTKGFAFSRNILDPAYKELAFYSFPNGFGLISPEGQIVYDCHSENLWLQEGENTNQLLLKGKAYLQRLYDDIASK